MCVTHRKCRTGKPQQYPQDQGRRHVAETGDRSGTRGPRDGPALLARDNRYRDPMVRDDSMKDSDRSYGRH